jgi:hypothetical protein
VAGEMEKIGEAKVIVAVDRISVGKTARIYYQVFIWITELASG